MGYSIHTTHTRAKLYALIERSRVTWCHFVKPPLANQHVQSSIFLSSTRKRKSMMHHVNSFQVNVISIDEKNACNGGFLKRTHGKNIQCYIIFDDTFSLPTAFLWLLFSVFFILDQKMRCSSTTWLYLWHCRRYSCRCTNANMMYYLENC